MRHRFWHWRRRAEVQKIEGCSRIEIKRIVARTGEDFHPIGQLEDDVIVFPGRIGDLVASRRRPALHAERTGHAEVHHQRVSGVQRDEQIFAAAFHCANPAADEARDKVWRKRPA